MTEANDRERCGRCVNWSARDEKPGCTLFQRWIWIDEWDWCDQFTEQPHD